MADGGKPLDTRDLRAAAAAHTHQVLMVLSEIVGDKEVAATVRVAAAKELLDRAHGKVGAMAAAPEVTPGPPKEISVRFVDPTPGRVLGV